MPHEESQLTATPPFDWRSHPAMVAVGTAVATTAFMVTIYSSIVIPTQLAKLENESIKKTSQIDSQKAALERSNSNLVDVNENLRRLQSKNDELNKIIAGLHEAALYQASANLFVQGNPYPSGLGKARIGMKRDEVMAATQV
jgi:hypothetical protein